MLQTGGFGVLQAGHIYETWWWTFFLLSGPPVLAGVCRKSALFWPKKAKHGRPAFDSTKSNGNALMGHMTSTYMAKHVLGPFCSLETPKNGRKWHKNWPFLTKKSQAWQACSWLNQTKWKRFDGPYDIYIDRKTCVRALLLIDNTQKWPKMTQKLPFFDQKKPSMAGLLLTQPSQMETL